MCEVREEYKKEFQRNKNQTQQGKVKRIRVI